MARFVRSGALLAALLLGFLLSTLAVAGPDQPPTVALTAPAGGSQYAAPATINLAATASDADGTVTKVEFYAGTQLIGNPVTAPPYTVTWSNVAAGSYSLTAKAYDNGGKSTVSAAVSVTVYQPTTVITSPAENALAPVSLGASLQGSFTGPAGTSLIISSGGLANATTNTSGGTFNTTVDVQEGPNTIEVQVARPDGTSEVATRHVTGVAPPAVVLTTPTDCGPFMLPATITFTADAVSTNATIAKVEFLEGAAFATVTSPPFVATETFTTAGSHSVQVRVTDSLGQVSYSPYYTFTTFSTPPAVNITSPANGATVRSGSPTTIAATATDSDGISSMSFTVSDGYSTQGGAALNQVTWTPQAPGTYVITVQATDNTGTQGSASITVTAVNDVPPSVSLTAPADGSSYFAPGTISFSANANDSDGTISKVDFLLNGAVAGTAMAPPYDVTVSGVAAGSYTVTARATDNSGLATDSSNSTHITVSANTPPSVSITAPTTGAAFDSPATTTITAAATDDGQVVNVEFFANGASIGTSTSSPYSVTWSNVGPGNYALTAVATDNAGASTTSAAVQVKVSMHTDPGETIVFLHNDTAGNTIAATDTSGALLWKENYRPFGDRLVRDPASLSNRTWFAGKAADAESGLSYFGARYYDPLAGRFMGVDAAQFRETNVHSFNRFAYGNNNPYRHLDPDGNSPIDLAFLAYDLYNLGAAIYAGEGVKGEIVNVGISVIGVLSPVPGTGLVIKAERAAEAARATERFLESAKRGRESEARVLKSIGEAKNRGAVGEVGNTSIPDFINERQIGEIKDVKRLSDSPQLRIQREAARAQGKEHVIITGLHTKVSREVEANSTVVRRRDLGPPKPQ